MMQRLDTGAFAQAELAQPLAFGRRKAVPVDALNKSGVTQGQIGQAQNRLLVV